MNWDKEQYLFSIAVLYASDKYVLQLLPLFYAWNHISYKNGQIQIHEILPRVSSFDIFSSCVNCKLDTATQSVHSHL